MSEDDKKINEALLKAAQTGHGAIPLTKDLIEQIKNNLTARMALIDETYPKLVAECPYETKLAVTAWVMGAIVDHAKEGGSFRYLIYDRLGFGPDAYVPLCNAGGLTISNEFDLVEKKDEQS